MDGASAAATIIAIATAGIQVAIKLVTISAQISTASERVSVVGNDVSLTASILQQLGDLIKQDATHSDGRVFNQEGLDSVQRSAFVCQRVFIELQKEIGKASVQLRNCERLEGGKVKLSRTEMARWPFVQPSINSLRDDLKEAKGSLMLLLQLWLLAIARRTAEFNNMLSSNIAEQQDMMRTIIALKAQSQLETCQGNGTTAQDIYQRPEQVVPQPKGITTDGVAPIQAIRALTLTASLEQDKVPSKKTNPVSVDALGAPPKSSDHTDTNSGNEVYDETESDRAEKVSTDLSLATALRSTNFERTDSAPLGAVFVRNPSWTSVRTRNAIDINTQDGDPSDLSLLQVKAVVRDNMVDSKGGVPSIDLVWHVYDLRLEQSVILDHLTQLKSQDRHSIIEMFDSLQDYERYMLDSVLKATTDQPKGTVIALKRTTADIQSRGMTFRQVPGLQVIMQRNLSQKPGMRTMLRSTMIRVKDWHPFPYRKERLPALSSPPAATPSSYMPMPSLSNRSPLTQANIASEFQQLSVGVEPDDSASQIVGYAGSIKGEQIVPPDSASNIGGYVASTAGSQAAPPPSELDAGSNVSSHREQHSGLGFLPGRYYPTRPVTLPHRNSPSTMSPGSAFGSMPPGIASDVPSYEPPETKVSMMRDDEAGVVDDLLKSYTTLFDKHDLSESDERSR